MRHTTEKHAAARKTHIGPGGSTSNSEVKKAAADLTMVKAPKNAKLAMQALKSAVVIACWVKLQ